MDYKILFTDFDDTLADDMIISEENKKAIKKAIEIGFKVMLSTGRSYLKLKEFEEELGITGKGLYGVAFNGALVYKVDTREVVYETRLDRNLALSIIDMIRKHNTSVFVYIKDKLYIEDETAPDILKYREKSMIEYEKVDRFEDIKEDFTKILIVHNGEDIDEIFKDIYPKVKDKCSMFYSSHNLIEFTDSSVSKGNGIKFVADKLNIDLKEVIAVGDSYNDISMIKMAGLGVAVENAVDDLKKAADYVTKNSCKDNAIKEVLEKFVIK